VQYLARVQDPYPVDYVSGTVALLRLSVLREVGLFDEEYFFSCEMADLCERIKRSEYECMIHPKAKAWHDMEMASSLRNTLYLYYSLRNRFLFIRKFRKKHEFKLRYRWMFVGCKAMIRAGVTGQPAMVRAVAYAMWDGIVGRFGKRNDLFVDGR
jgi:GT2 family glycosyltransferase